MYLPHLLDLSGEGFFFPEFYFKWWFSICVVFIELHHLRSVILACEVLMSDYYLVAILSLDQLANSFIISICQTWVFIHCNQTPIFYLMV